MTRCVVKHGVTVTGVNVNGFGRTAVTGDMPVSPVNYCRTFQIDCSTVHLISVPNLMIAYHRAFSIGFAVFTYVYYASLHPYTDTSNPRCFGAMLNIAVTVYYRMPLDIGYGSRLITRI